MAFKANGDGIAFSVGQDKLGVPSASSCTACRRVRWLVLLERIRLGKFKMKGNRMKSTSRRTQAPGTLGSCEREMNSRSNHPRPGREHVPSFLDDPTQTKTAPTASRLSVEVDSKIYLEWEGAPNHHICHDHKYGDANIEDVLRATTAQMRGEMSPDNILQCMVAMRKSHVAPDAFLFAEMIWSLVKCGDLEAAADMFHEMRAYKLVPTPLTCSALLDACRKAGLVERMREIYAAMHEERIPRNALVCHLHSQPFRKTDASAVQRNTMGHLRDFECSWPEARACLDEMRRVGVEPDPGVRRAAVGIYAQKNLGKGAEPVLHDLTHAGIPVDFITLGQLVALCEKVDHSEVPWKLTDMVSRELLDKAIELGILKPGLGYVDAAEAIGSSKAVDFHSNAVVMAPASETSMLSYYLTMAVFKYHHWKGIIDQDTQFIVGMSNAETRRAVDQCMRAMGLAPVALVKRDGTRNLGRLECGHTALLRCLGMRQTVSARTVFDEMTEQGILPSAVFEKLLAAPVEPKVDICNAMIQMFEQCGLTNDAIAAFNRMLQHGVKPNAGSYFAVIAACQRGYEAPENTIRSLIDIAVERGFIRKGLGHNAAECTVSFRIDDIVSEPAELPPVMSPYLAQALFKYHQSQGHIALNTKLVIGGDDDKSVRGAILELIPQTHLKPVVH